MSDAQKKKLFGKAVSGILAFIALTLLNVGAAFNAQVLGMGLQQFSMVFLALQFAVMLFMAYLVFQDGKAHAHQQHQEQQAVQKQ